MGQKSFCEPSALPPTTRCRCSSAPRTTCRPGPLRAGSRCSTRRWLPGAARKTSVAAATARRCAAAGLRTVVLSTDPAHSLSDSLEAELGPEPTRAGANLFGQEVQAQEEMERHWDSVQGWLGSLLEERGIDRISAEELTVPPGMDELFSLLQIKAHHDSGDYDAIIVDCAPTGETLRLLSFPDVASWWLEKVFPWEKRLYAAARPFARTFLDIPMPSEAVFDDVQRLEIACRINDEFTVDVMPSACGHHWSELAPYVDSEPSLLSDMGTLGCRPPRARRLHCESAHAAARATE